MSARRRDLPTAALHAAVTANALHPVSRRHPPAALAFVAGWHVSELPVLALGGVALGAADLLRRQAWRHPAGRAALLLEAASAAGLTVLARQAGAASGVLEAALIEGLGPDYGEAVAATGLEVPAPLSWYAGAVPAWLSGRTHLHTADISYGPYGRRNLLDVWRRPDLPSDRPAPVIVQVPGGGWTIGDKRHQAYPLLTRLVAAGWVAVPINYRLSPRATWPDHIVDVKRALVWVKDHIAEYGGDPDFVAITGGSAGGHLSSLAALSANVAMFQPGFEDADTSVAAAVPFYGVYDLADWDDHGGQAMCVRHLESMVLKTSLAEGAELWRAASPLSWVDHDPPPIMVLHGTNDSLVPVESARRFVGALRTASSQPVVYGELPGAQHAFDIYGSSRTLATVSAVERFLAFVRSGREAAASTSSSSAAPRQLA